MRDLDTINSDLSIADRLRWQALTHTVNLALEVVATLMVECWPDAVQLEVTETDQDLSGALWASSWIDAGGERHDLDEDPDNVAMEQELNQALNWLDDSTKGLWEGFTVNGISKRNGASPLDVRTIVEHFTDGQPEEPPVIGLLTALATCIKDGEPNGEGGDFVMENDDAYTTLHSFITNARTILGLPERVCNHDPAAVTDGVCECGAQVPS